MIDQDIATLAQRHDRDLHGLEADVWRREREWRAARKAGRKLASLQAVVVAFAVVSSAAVGAAVAADRTQSPSAVPFNPGGDLAPSALLFGNRP